MRTVAAYTLVSETHAPLSRLHSAGIDAVLRNDFTIMADWSLSNALGGVKIDVPTEDYEVSRALLRLAPEDPGVLSCAHCGSPDLHVHPINGFAVFCLIASLPIPQRLITVICRACQKKQSVPRV